jgi:hypothetical protein
VDEQGEDPAGVQKAETQIDSAKWELSATGARSPLGKEPKKWRLVEEEKTDDQRKGETATEGGQKREPHQ